MEWIKCSERLPEIGQLVLIFNGAPHPIHSAVFEKWESDSDLPKAFYECGEDTGIFGNVTHWAPLPEPPDSDGGCDKEEDA